MELEPPTRRAAHGLTDRQTDSILVYCLQIHQNIIAVINWGEQGESHIVSQGRIHMEFDIDMWLKELDDGKILTGKPYI